MNSTDLLFHHLPSGAEAFSTCRDAALPYDVLQPHQVHGDVVRIVDRYGMVRDDLQGVDAVITALPGCPIAVRTADCVPVFLFDPIHRVVAAVHSGWRGTVLRISQKTIRVMMEHFASLSSDLHAIIGPSIGLDSFQVGQEVVDSFAEAGFPMEKILVDFGERVEGTMRGGLHIDLWQANRWLLLQSGLHAENISVAGIDTYAHNDLFFSARHEGRHCGRIINAIRLT